MSQKHTITIEIDETGQIKSTVGGVSGPDCGKLTSWLEGLGETTLDEHTPDFYATPQVAHLTNKAGGK